MKKRTLVLFALTLCLCAALLVLPASAASTYTEGDWTYSVSGDTVTVVSYNGSSSSVTLPTDVTLNGYELKPTIIGASAFAGNKSLKSVVIPEQYTTLGNAAFKNCVNLSSITINGSLNNLSEYSTYNGGYVYPDNRYDYQYSAFYNAGTSTSGITVTFGPRVKWVPAYLFATAHGKIDGVFPKVTKVVLSENISRIGSYAFYNCYELKTVDFSGCKSLANIYSLAFYNCESIKSLDFPEGLVSISDKAFYNCKSLVELTLPESATTIGNVAFANTVKLEKLTVKGSLNDFSKYSTYNGAYVYPDNRYASDYAPFYNSGHEGSGIVVTFGYKSKWVPAYMFSTGNDALDEVYPKVTEVYLNENIQNIGADAFYRCIELKKVHFENASSLHTINRAAFLGCEALTEAILPDNLQTIGESAFRACFSLKKVVIPVSATSLGDRAFQYCYKLMDLTINGSLNASSKYGSYNGAYVYPDNRYDYDYAPFYEAGRSTDGITVTFGPKVKWVPAYLFATGHDAIDEKNPKVTKVVLSSNIKTIGAYAFYRCYDLKEVVFKNATALTTVGESAFMRCTSLVSADLPASVVTIEEDAFWGNTSLKSAVIPEKCTTLGNRAFKNCTALTRITINGSLNASSMYGTYNGAYVYPDNRYDYDYAPFYKAGQEAGGITVTFGPKAKWIPSYIFATGHDKIDEVYAKVTTVNINSNVKEIGYAAFWNCYDLKTINYAGSQSDYAKITQNTPGSYFTSAKVNYNVEIADVSDPSNPFKDVKPSDYFFEPVLWAVDKGITKGTTATTFTPGGKCTRAHILTFLYRAYGEPAVSGNNPFTDVKESAYYYKAALWAYQNGMVSSGALEPDHACIRSEAVFYMWCAEGRPEGSKGSDRFTDVPESSAYNAAIGWAVDAGVTKGTSKTEFGYWGTTTRGQIVTFLYRYKA
ncbi:MAG: leucine-rich repeat protein [Oscillospiraceae bacterium]|nr:leucine-rich repeat protein [Oscillospiraceae bacterium]